MKYTLQMSQLLQRIAGDHNFFACALSYCFSITDTISFPICFLSKTLEKGNHQTKHAWRGSQTFSGDAGSEIYLYSFPA